MLLHDNVLILFIVCLVTVHNRNTLYAIESFSIIFVLRSHNKGKHDLPEIANFSENKKK